MIAKQEMRRIIGEYGILESENLIICMAGLHGNEPAGVLALELVMQNLKKKRVKLDAKFVALTGNIQALKENKRFLEKDLNRIWFNKQLEDEKEYHIPDVQELLEIQKLIDSFDSPTYKQKIFIDLHTTSAQNGIFMVSSNLEKSKYITKHLKCPVILGLEQILEGALINFMAKLDFTSFAFEGGQHTARESIQNMEWMLWNTFLASGCIEGNHIPVEIQEYGELNHFNKSLPEVLEVVYRHEIDETDCFKMLNGFENFSPIKKGQLLAKDKKGEVKAERNGYLLMPLYQDKGEDGFFIVRAIHS